MGSGLGVRLLRRPVTHGLQDDRWESGCDRTTNLRRFSQIIASSSSGTGIKVEKWVQRTLKVRGSELHSGKGG